MCNIRMMHERQKYIYSFSTEDIRVVLTSLLRSYAVHLQMHPTDSDMHHGKHPSSLWRRIMLSCVKRILYSGTKEIFPLTGQFSNTEVRVLKHGGPKTSVYVEGHLFSWNRRDVGCPSAFVEAANVTYPASQEAGNSFSPGFIVDISGPRLHWSVPLFNRCPPGANEKTLCVALFVFRVKKSSSVVAVKMWHRRANIYGCRWIWNTAPSKTLTCFILLSGQRGKEGNRRTITSSALNPVLLGFLFWNLPITSPAYKSFTWPPKHTHTHTCTPHVPYWTLQRQRRRK